MPSVPEVGRLEGRRRTSLQEGEGVSSDAQISEVRNLTEKLKPENLRLSCVVRGKSTSKVRLQMASLDLRRRFVVHHEGTWQEPGE